MSQGTAKQRRLLSLALIVLASASLGMLVDWRAPGVHRYAEDWLMRERGPLPVPSDIAIVAIDEKSIAAYGRFPWPRQVLAKTIQAVSGSDPMVIAVDVLFADPSAPEDDALLAQAIGHAHNVVLGAQLVDSPVPGLCQCRFLPLLRRELDMSMSKWSRKAWRAKWLCKPRTIRG